LAFNETVVPFTNEAADNLLRYEILKNQTAVLQKKVFLRDESRGELKRVIYLDELDAKAGTMTGVIMHEFDGGRMTRFSMGQRGIWRDGEWWVEDGQVFEISDQGEVRLLFRYERQKLLLNLTPDQLQRRTKRPVDMSAWELWDYINQAGMGGGNLAQVRVLFHLKLAVPWACVVLALLGASFGATRHGRSGSSVGFGISVVFVFAYYVVMSLCRALGESSKMSPILAAWVPNCVFLTTGIFFSRKVN